MVIVAVSPLVVAEGDAVVVVVLLVVSLVLTGRDGVGLGVVVEPPLWVPPGLVVGMLGVWSLLELPPV